MAEEVDDVVGLKAERSAVRHGHEAGQSRSAVGGCPLSDRGCVRPMAAVAVVCLGHLGRGTQVVEYFAEARERE